MRKLLLPNAIIRIELIEAESVIPTIDVKYARIGRVVDVPAATDFNNYYATAPDNRNPQIGDIMFFDEFSYRKYEYEGETYHLVDMDPTKGGHWGLLREYAEKESVPSTGDIA